ncbi:hypothetical protein GHT06_006578 [Daphnia sinensis]|uniref:Helitron helicase-like domain-containing protein n=1 Tax=Daphnia sinensis TaxID=1820382 RepID=A0AAD5KT91_9CRUS|nr:hypothetical protein GHT06_006578 [Daphnia sinensis]
MFPSFDDVDYEFESEIKKTRELSCVLDFYANSIKNAQEDGFKKLIQIIESRNPDPDMEELEHEIHEFHEMFVKNLDSGLRVKCHDLSMISIEAIIGWDRDKKRPFRRGGIFGVPKAFCEAVEEQGRLTLHVHCLLWLAGHRNLHKQIEREYLEKNLEKVTSSHDNTSKIWTVEMESENSYETSSEDISHRAANNASSGREANERCTIIANELTNHIASFCLAELSLPETEKNLIGQCIKPNCNGILQLTDGEKTLEKMRKRVKIDAIEIPCL